jgi:hypothetical protein
MEKTALWGRRRQSSPRSSRNMEARAVITHAMRDTCESSSKSSNVKKSSGQPFSLSLLPPGAAPPEPSGCPATTAESSPWWQCALSPPAGQPKAALESSAAPGISVAARCLPSVPGAPCLRAFCRVGVLRQATCVPRVVVYTSRPAVARASAPQPGATMPSGSIIGPVPCGWSRPSPLRMPPCTERSGSPG